MSALAQDPGAVPIRSNKWCIPRCMTWRIPVGDAQCTLQLPVLPWSFGKTPSMEDVRMRELSNQYDLEMLRIHWLLCLSWLQMRRQDQVTSLRHPIPHYMFDLVWGRLLSSLHVIVAPSHPTPHLFSPTIQNLSHRIPGVRKAFVRWGKPLF